MDKSLRGKVAIVGVADTEVGVLPGRTPMELGVEAALAAIADAGLEKNDVDGEMIEDNDSMPELEDDDIMSELSELSELEDDDIMSELDEDDNTQIGVEINIIKYSTTTDKLMNQNN